MNRRAEIWISAVIYIAIGVIVISLILAAALPLIDKLKDRNTSAETKNLLLTMDDTIRIVATEGPGSQRELAPLRITQGELFVNDKEETISWQLKTSAVIIEPQVPIKEGPLTIYLNTTPVKNEYIMTMSLSFKDSLDVVLDSAYQPPFAGVYSMLVLHNGTFTTLKSKKVVPAITLKVV